MPVCRQRYKSKDWVHRKTIVKQANSLLILEVKDEECLVGPTGTARFLHQILDRDKPLSMSLKELFQLFEMEPSELKAKDRVLQERLLRGFELLPKADTADTADTEQGEFFRQACLYIKEHIYNHSSESSKPFD